MRSWPGNTLLHHPFFSPLLLIAVILAVYYPAMYSGFHPIDDTAIVTFYSASPSITHLLTPGSSYYYRPLIELTFWFDNWLWGMEPSVMHLENILIHCANSLLVFLLARRACGNDNSLTLLMSILSALMFAMHPVNVEAVAWIAGRADILCTLFVLSATCFWLRWFESAKRKDITAALLLSCAALLTKETAFALGAVVFAMALAMPGLVKVSQRCKAICCVALPAIFLITFALIFRSSTSGFGRFLSGIDLPIASSLWNAFAALGFYAKKLIFPFPLNFAITEVSPWYGFLAIVLVPLLWQQYRCCRTSAIFSVAAVLMLLPVLVLAVKPIAWTPVAERYLYLPSAFFCAGISVLILSFAVQVRQIVVVGMVLMICGFSVASFQRVLLWKDKLAFFQDAVAKSPGFGSLYNEFGSILLQREELRQADEAFLTADRLNNRDSMRFLIKANLMSVQYAKGNDEGVREMFFRLFKTKDAAPADFLELLYRADSRRMHRLAGKNRVLLAEDLLETLHQLNLKRPNPFWLYRSGQISLVTGNTARAADFFRRSHAAAPPDAHYRGAAESYLKKLEQKQQ